MKREESRQLEGLVDAVGVSVPVYNADSEWRGSHHRRDLTHHTTPPLPTVE